MKINRLRQTNRHVDMIVFIAVLATGILLILLHVPADSLATVATALSALYGTWVSRRPSSPPPDSPTPQKSSPPIPTDPADAAATKKLVR